MATPLPANNIWQFDSAAYVADTAAASNSAPLPDVAAEYNWTPSTSSPVHGNLAAGVGTSAPAALYHDLSELFDLCRSKRDLDALIDLELLFDQIFPPEPKNFTPSDNL